MVDLASSPQRLPRVNARLERKLQRLVAVIVVGTLSGIAVGFTHGSGASALITGTIYGFLLGAIIGAVELFALEDWDWLNRLSFLANLAVRSAVYAAIIIGIQLLQPGERIAGVPMGAS
ncbi:MAG TPA: hypothetical protein VF583_11515, partial [Bradyrhizobium sp.]